MTSASSDDSPGPRSDRSRVRRLADHAAYDRDTIDAILDAAVVGHVGVVDDDGQPFVIPMAIARRGDEVLVHGSVASRLLRSGASGVPLCLTVTLLDGVIVARSLFESSLRYRSVMVLGNAREVSDPDEQSAALEALAEHLIPGRAAEVRPSHQVELKQTKVFTLPLDEASAKVSVGWSDDPDDDIAGDAWAGVVPMWVVAGDPLPAPDLRDGIAVPASVIRLGSTLRNGGGGR